MTTETPPHRKAERRLTDLAMRDGPPLTTTELAKMTGMSPTFIREEIRTGHLRAARIGRGQKCVFRIPIGDARAYASRLGFI
jgi:excisionase family DNA binding protein